MSEQTIYSLTVKFTGPLLGSQPGRDTPSSDYLKEKVKKQNAKVSKPTEAELAEEEMTLPEELEKGTTGFHRGPNKEPLLFNYQVKGMIKECGSVMNGLMGTSNLKSKIDNLVFVSPRTIPLTLPEGAVEGILERPLRAETAKGPRTTLARSEMIPEGATFKCQVKVIKSPKVNLKEDLLRELLDYGTNKGLGQWRNSGLYGQFEYELEEVKQAE